MKTLAEILDNETSLAVIFGHVHRRQKELSPILRSQDRTIVYEAAAVTDLVDYVFIVEFNDTLTGYQFMLTSRPAADVECHENVERYNALEAAGIDHKRQCKIKREATSAAHKVMCGTIED